MLIRLDNTTTQSHFFYQISQKMTMLCDVNVDISNVNSQQNIGGEEYMNKIIYMTFVLFTIITDHTCAQQSVNRHLLNTSSPLIEKASDLTILATENDKLIPSDGTNGDQFGIAVSIDGNRALVGAYHDDDNGSNSGAVYVFEFDGTTWQQTQKLTASDAAANDQFGISVSLSGNRALIGANFDDDTNMDSGSAYIFDFDGSNWQQTHKLNANVSSEIAYFGQAVSLSGNRALIGAWLDTNEGFGAAYIFDFNGSNWIETDKIYTTNDHPGAEFGWSVSLSGDRAIIGTRFGNSSDAIEEFVGTASIFEFDGISSWTESIKLSADDGREFDEFGYSVSISGDYALVGAQEDDDNGNNSGSAYVFKFDGSTWSQIQKLHANDASAGSNFGSAVSLSGNQALIGANAADVNGINAGAAYVFQMTNNTWTQTQKYMASDAASDNSFGDAIGFSGANAIIGSPGDMSGSAYIFRGEDLIFTNGFE